MSRKNQFVLLLTSLLLLGQPTAERGSLSESLNYGSTEYQSRFASRGKAGFRHVGHRGASGLSVLQDRTDFLDAAAYLNLDELTVSGLPRTVMVKAEGTYRLRLSAPQGNMIPTELLGLDLVGAIPGTAGLGLIQIRENPNRVSMGRINLSPGGGGSVQIDSFFDVFFEVNSFTRNSNSMPLGLEGQVRNIPLCRESCSTPMRNAPVPLLNPQGQTIGRISRMDVYFCQPMGFSVAKGGPSGLDPADILGPGSPPVVLVEKARLGLREGDDIDALSDGMDFLLSRFRSFPRFSVDPASRGAMPSAVRSESTVTPPEAHGDEFGLKPFGPSDNPCVGPGPNYLCYDENGVPGSLTATPIGLRVCDDVDGLMEYIPGGSTAIYFSLAPGSPTLAALGASAADILVSTVGGMPSVYATATQLGLRAGDNLDALCLMESGDRRYVSAADLLQFSLAPGSPSLTGVLGGLSAADILTPSPLRVAVPAADLGLLRTDNLNALKCRAQP